VSIDQVRRCSWANSSIEYSNYHDQEWSVPIREDHALYERLVLEGFQSGLSWITVLRKRENFRKAFSGFEVEKVARFNSKKVETLLQDEGIIRHRGKIEAAIKNAQALISMWEQYGQGWLTQTLESYAPSEKSLRAQGFRRPPVRLDQLPSKCTETEQLSRHLKGLGFGFVGPTTLYAALQATGFVNDHVTECDFYSQNSD
jgi:DNA-3-methyladenine glycosylase I